MKFTGGCFKTFLTAVHLDMYFFFVTLCLIQNLWHFYRQKPSYSPVGQTTTLEWEGRGFDSLPEGFRVEGFRIRFPATSGLGSIPCTLANGPGWIQKYKFWHSRIYLYLTIAPTLDQSSVIVKYSKNNPVNSQVPKKCNSTELLFKGKSTIHIALLLYDVHAVTLQSVFVIRCWILFVVVLNILESKHVKIRKK